MANNKRGSSVQGHQRQTIDGTDRFLTLTHGHWTLYAEDSPCFVERKAAASGTVNTASGGPAHYLPAGASLDIEIERFAAENLVIAVVRSGTGTGTLYAMKHEG